MSLWGKKSETETGNQSQPQAGGSFEEAAARVSAEVPREDAPETAAAEEGETLELRPEWGVIIARAPFELVSKFYHPAFALSDEQAEYLGPKLLPLVKKFTDEWIPSWLAGVSNRNPEVTDALGAFLYVGFIQWQYVQKIRKMEARLSAERQQPAERKEAEEFAAKAVASVELPADPPRRPKAGERDKDGVLVI